jgi:protoporphyrinogen oxidase
MLTNTEATLLRALMCMNALMMAAIGAFFVGAGLWLATAILLVRGGQNVGQHLSLLAIFLPGYQISWTGAWIGALWGALVGGVSGAVLYWSYSRTVRHHLNTQLIGEEPSRLFQLPVFRISGPALGVAVGLLGATQLLVSTGWLVLRGTAADNPNAALLASYLPGYSISWSGSLIGSLELFAILFVASVLFSTVYNVIATRKGPRAERPVRHEAPPRSKPAHVVILGAGPAGLATGHELSANGVKVTVLEHNSYVGGLCRTVHDGGYKFDLGGHRWFTKNEELNNWFRRLMEGHLVLVNRVSRIYYGGVYFQYPITIGDVVRKAGPLTIVKAGMSFVWSLMRYGAFGRPIRNMKDAYTAQFGSTLYQMFFRRYTEKVWGKPCELLSPDWVSQRSKGLSIWTVTREALSSRKTRVTSLIDEFMYPRDGYMRIPERMAEDIMKAGNEIRLGATVQRVVREGPENVEVFFNGPNGLESIRATDVVSTIPLGVLVQIMSPQAGERVLRAARALEFRDLVTVNLKIRKKQVSGDTWLYVQDENVVFGRLHEPKNWSKAMVPDDDHTSLVLECFCTVGDAIWSMSDEEVARLCVKDLVEKLHFLEASDVEGWTVVRTRNAYPVYDLQYSEKLARIKSFLAQCDGIHVVGRGGTFRYNNADHSIEMGLLLARRIMGQAIDHMEVNTEQEYHEEKVEGDPARDHYRVRELRPVVD